MSDHDPTSSDATPEYLDSQAGQALDSPTPAPQRRSRRTTWWIAGGVVGLVAVGAGAWAAMSFFQQGSQPAEALPSTTIGYVAVDLDPAGSQKIDAFRTLNKFPAFKDQVGVGSVDDIRRKVGEAAVADLGCAGVTYASDVEPWLGSRAAFAAVDPGGDQKLEPVAVLQVTDEGKAETALKTISTCSSDSDSEGGYAVHDGWVVVAETQQIADDVVSATDDGTLADDSSYQKWTKEVGDSGVVNMYAAPAAGEYLATHADELSSAFSFYGSSIAGEDPLAGQDPPALSSEMTDMLKNFQGAAATIRFDGDGLEFAGAGDAAVSQAGLLGDQAGSAVAGLPDDTTAAIGLSLKPGWFTQVLDRVAAGVGEGQTSDQLMQQLSSETGLQLPDDAETLLGNATTLSVGPGLDIEKASQSPDGNGIPVAMTVTGDPSGVDGVLDRFRQQDASLETILGSDTDGDTIAVGPTPAYRQAVLEGGNLGGTTAFKSVVPETDHAGMVLFLDLGSLQKAVSQFSQDDPEVADNLAPLQALGLSTWTDGDVAHASFQISTR